MVNVCCYIDGFNIYHAIDDASRARRGALNHLKWVNLRALMAQFTDPNVHQIVRVKFFTAYPTWKPDSEARHREYVKALNHYGVEEILGQFKPKDAYCKICRSTYKAREEKESDVNIAMHLVSDAHENLFDQAFLVTNDSDLLGPVRLVREKFPNKRIKIISPPFRRHSKELWAAATHRATVGQNHLEASLMPASVQDANGVNIFTRPQAYDPPV
ncbi:MAG: NYN domain-containing protein [Hyphomicrobiaceae bacterium]|nr:NYN domain-containing protein [Hyphomicrobiaceae bacterium]